MQFKPAGHITGVYTGAFDLTARVPWVYMIACVSARVLYIGESFADGGLVSRLSSHFGPYPGSSLKQKAERIARVTALSPPFVVIAARLPGVDDNEAFDATNKQVRLLLESLLHTDAARVFLTEYPAWTIVSETSGARISATAPLEQTCHSILNCFLSAYQFLSPLGASSPFQVVLLEKHSPLS